ncbi:MAG: M20/M25/M40 family metallo-hydrolase [Vicinamibacterales bacterium]
MSLTNRLLAVTTALALVTSCHSTKTTPTVPPGAPAQTRPEPRAPAAAEPRAGTITEVSIRAHMGFLASDALNGRGSGTRDEWITATYIGAALQRWGIEPLGDDGGFVQRIATGRVLATAPPVLTIPGGTFTHGRDMLVQSLGSGKASGPLVKVRAGSPVPAVAFALLPEGAAPDATTNAAAAVLVVETPQVRSTWDAAGSRLPSSAPQRGGGAPQPRIVLSRAAYERLSMVADGTTISFDAPVSPGYTWNAIGRVTGADPVRSSEVILLTAHLDHLGARGIGEDTIYNGADDDASGTTAVLELAEAIAGGPRPKRTVVFAWFGSEESGGYGARHFLDAPPVPLERIAANLEFEMIARADDKVPPHTLWLTGYERSNLGPELARQGARIVADPHPDQNFFQRSDNIQLACRGVIAQTVSSFGLHTDYHRPSDDLSKVDFAHMTDAIQSMFAPVMWLANSDFKPDWLPGQKPGPPSPCRQ